MFPLAQKDQQTRKIFIFLLIFEFLISFLGQKPAYLNSLGIFVGFILGAAITATIPTFILYYCALKRPGTKWLLFLNYLRCMGVILFAVSAINEMPARMSLLFWISFLLDVVLIYFTHKMREINIAAQIYFISKANPELFPSWDRSSSAQELAILFRIAVEEFPRYQRGLKREYNKYKIKFAN